MRCHVTVMTHGHKLFVRERYAGLSAFFCIAVLTAGHCCLGSIEIFVTLSAYDLEAWPPEEGVHKYTAVDKLLPRQYLKDRDQFKNWDVCVLILPEDVNITTAPIGEPLRVAHRQHAPLRLHFVAGIDHYICRLARLFSPLSWSLVCCRC